MRCTKRLQNGISVESKPKRVASRSQNHLRYPQNSDRKNSVITPESHPWKVGDSLFLFRLGDVKNGSFVQFSPIFRWRTQRNRRRNAVSWARTPRVWPLQPTRQRNDSRDCQGRLTLMKIIIYLFFLIACIALILVIFRLTRTALRTLFKSLDIKKKVKTFKSWLDQNSNE